MPIDARKLHEDALIVDGLNAGGPYQEWNPLLKKGGVDATVTTIGWMQGTLGTMRDIEFLMDRIEESPDALTFATTATQIEGAKRNSKTAVVMCSQNTRLIEDEVRLLDTFHAVGMRIIQLAYNEANLVGDGCTEPRDAGLTDFGRAVVKRMNKLGMLIDAAHCGDQTTLDIIEASIAEQRMTGLPIDYCGSFQRLDLGHPFWIPYFNCHDIARGPGDGLDTIQNHEIKPRGRVGQVVRHHQFDRRRGAKGFFQQAIALRHEQHLGGARQHAHDGSLVIGRQQVFASEPHREHPVT